MISFKSMKQPFVCFLLAFFCRSLFSYEVLAQQPIPAKPQEKPLLILNGNIHDGKGNLIEDGAIAIEKGVISFVGPAKEFKEDNSRFEVLDVKGKEVYPGLIACNTVLGMSEIEMVRATNDVYEVGGFNPEIRSVISYNTDSKVTPTVRSNGVLLAEIVPGGGIISGKSAVMELDGWNWEDAVYKADAGIHMNWPSIAPAQYLKPDEAEKRMERTKQSIRDIENYFDEALAYCNGAPEVKNLGFEAMRGVLYGKEPVFIHAGFVSDIVSAVRFAKSKNLKLVIVGGYDSWRVTTLLKESNVSVVLDRPHSLPAREDEDVDQPFKTPKILWNAGIPFCVSVDGFWQVRNLPFMAGTVASTGLSTEEALMTVTYFPAKILGLDKTLGTLEKGKDGTLVISSGDLLDMKTSKPIAAFIRGKSISLENIQTELSRKFRKKYNLAE